MERTDLIEQLEGFHNESRLPYVTDAKELGVLPIGTKLYSYRTTHSWEISDYPALFVTGTGGGYTYMKDFIEHEWPLIILYKPEESVHV
jgi:hypothetical protein